MNIALFGYGGSEHKSGNYLADSIQIMSVDPNTNKTTVIPIPRDFWIEGLPQLPDNGKINEAFAIGWQQGGVEEAAAKTTEILSEVTGLQIHHWMAIDFAGFREMIDAVGGVEVNNPRAFRYTWNHVAIRPQHLGRPLRTRARSTSTASARWPMPERDTPVCRASRATSPDPSASSASWVRCAPSSGAAALAHWGRACR